MIISTASTPLPSLPPELGTPRQLSVPRLSALTEEQLRIKTAIWPIAYTPHQRNKQPEFTKEQVERIGKGLRSVVEEALRAKGEGQVSEATRPVTGGAIYSIWYKNRSLSRLVCSRTRVNFYMSHMTLGHLRDTHYDMLSSTSSVRSRLPLPPFLRLPSRPRMDSFIF